MNKEAYIPQQLKSILCVDDISKFVKIKGDNTAES